MTRQELRVFLDEWFCGCGSPSDATLALLRLLELHPLYEHQDELKRMLPDGGLRYLTLYTLDYFDLSEHGGTVGGSWLTDKGKAVLAALQREAGDEFQALHVQHCCHGYAAETDELFQCPECGPLNT